MQPRIKPLGENVLIFMDAGRVWPFIKEPGTAKPAAGNALHPGWRSKQCRAEAPPAPTPHPMQPLGELGEGPMSLVTDVHLG